MTLRELEIALDNATRVKDALFDQYLAAYKTWADLSIRLLEAKLAPQTDVAPGASPVVTQGPTAPNPGADLDKQT